MKPFLLREFRYIVRLLTSNFVNDKSVVNLLKINMSRTETILVVVIGFCYAIK